MGAFLAIIFFVVYINYMDKLKDNAVNNYNMKNVDTLKLTMDMDKPVRIREQNLLAGKYDFKEGEYNWKTGKRI